MVAWNDLRVYLIGLMLVTVVWGEEAQPPAPEPETVAAPEAAIKIDQVDVTGRIDGEQFAVTLQFEAQVDRVPATLPLIQGLAVLDTLTAPATQNQLSYDPSERTYRLAWNKKGRYPVDATFMVASQISRNSPWREATLEVPAGRVRQIRLISSQADIDVQIPGALNVQRSIEHGQLVIEALLGPREALQVQWKPQVQLTGAELVLSSETNTIVDVRAGLMHVDSLFGFQVAQGQIESLAFNVPTGLRVTSLEGSSIRSWSVGDADDGIRPLRVELSRPQTNVYYLRIQAEMAMDALPATVDVPVIEPTGGIRASGQLAVGTNSALQLVVQDSSGLTQIDAAAFARVRTSDSQVRNIPTGKAFFYSYAGSRYRLSLLTDDIVPAYEVADRFVARIKEDDLQVEAELELDVRDAPIRQLEIVIPAGWIVAALSGEQVEDYHLPEAVAEGQDATVRVTFKEPVLGRTLLGLRLELGRGPLDETQRLAPLQVVGAKTQRGYVIVATETGIELDPPVAENLREVHTASVPLRVSAAQYAYRFRDADWTLSLLARRRPAEVRAEVFHLQSLSQTLAYGSAVVNYLIAGSPVDELSFRLPSTFENVEFVGRDVRRWERQGDLWVVRLTRKVLGDYNLAVTYTQRHSPSQPIQLGALECADVQTQTGYVVVTSHLDLRLNMSPDQAANQVGLLPINLDELPADYRLLTSSPILAAYKYVTIPHTGTLAIDPYQRSELLPVVVDIADIQTRLAVRPDGRVESATTIRYEVKNTTGQFLALTMPAGANIWSVSLIERTANGSEVSTRLAASHDDSTGQLLVPLRRQANPNDPLTIQLEYGQAHESGRQWRPQVRLEAPRSAVPVVYADWRVVVPDGWTTESNGGNMRPQTQPQSRASLALLLRQLGHLWGRSAERWAASSQRWALLIVAAVAIIVTAVARRVWLPELVVLLVLIGLIWIGIGAATGKVVPPTASTTISYAQPVSIESAEALTVSVGLVPTWRRGIEIGDIVAVAVVVLAAVALALVRRSWWKIALAAAVTAVVYLAAKIPQAWPVLKALGTWMPPVGLTVWFVYRLWRRPSVPARVALATLVLLVACTSSGCSTMGGPEHRPALADAVIERIDCALQAGDDSMELAYRVRLIADKPASVPLLAESAVLTSPADVAEHVTLRTEKGRHVIAIDKAGTYDVNVTFLTPLPPAGTDQQRHFILPLPPALTNAVSLVIPDANVAALAPGALFLDEIQEQQQTRLDAKFAPGQSARFTWRPRERQAAQEETRFYAQDQALAYVTPGLLQVFHTIRLQIAQGQVDRLSLDVREGQTVTAVNGPQVGAWRYDPAARRLEIRLNQPAVGSYAVGVVTQSANASVPYDVRLEPLTVDEALDQLSIVALAEEPSVYVRLEQHPATMNIQDYVREVGTLVSTAPGVTVDRISQAFRFDAAGTVVTGRVLAVQSEVRSQETARFNVEDDRLVYNSQWNIEIAKAGRFDIDLVVPEGFDIDALDAEQVSHWDETTEDGQRRIRVHFKHQLMGVVPLRLTLSRAVAEIPDRLSPPRVMLVGAVKHTGYLLVGSEQGVRISVASRQGVSEMNPAELGQTEQGLLAFQFLRSDWDIQLQTELIQPRITVQGLHIAKVTDGLVRHQHALRYQLYHAGAKTFTLTLPQGALGVTISGAGIARREQTAPQQWQVELADKVYERPFLMTVTYETRYNAADGNVPLLPVQCLEADLQQGYTVVFATDRVELAPGTVDNTLRPADARSIPAYFGAGDLSGAAMCYRSQSAQYSLVVQATRHLAAEQMGAEVLRTDLFSVVTTAGQTIDRASLRLRVGTQRHLQTILPEGATIWSLAVDGQAVQPSLRTTSNQRQALLIPLPQQASDDVSVDLVYVTPLAASQSAGAAWSGPHALVGPRFDLPLKNITWQVYLPQDFHYDDFGGTMSVDPQATGAGFVVRYGRQTYLQRMVEVNRRNDSVAQQQQDRARELAQMGDQTAARQALTKGYNFSMGNSALNEDIRVDLDNLVRQQAMVGLINARDRLRQQSGVSQAGGAAMPTESFSTQQAERLASSLGQADNENLDLITRRIIQTQAAAEAPVSQLQVAVPTCGQVYQFSSPLQVEPAAEIAVTFSAKPRHQAGIGGDTWWGLGLFGALLLGGFAIKGVGCLAPRLHAALTPAPKPAMPAEPKAPAPTQTPNDTAEPDDKLSSDELL